MATRKDKTLRPQLVTLFNLGAIRELTDGQLLERFVTDRSEMAELAFAALVERHSAMVMRVCRARLASLHDAQDAFQATFLILVKKARTLWVQDSLGPWLHQVALRTATCARDEAARRKRYERQAAERTTGLDRGERSGIDSDLSAMLHEAIDRLPERYRVPIILCDLEGRSCEDAARRMGRPVGTVKSWRARGRARLRQRLIQVGLAPSATWESTLAADLARAAGPKPEAATVRAATQIQANPKTTGDIPASVYVLIKGVMKTMILSKFRTAAAFLCALTLFTAGLGTVARVAAEDATATPPQPFTEAPNPTSMLKPQATPPVLEELGDEIWQLTLPDAIRIGLEATEGIQLVKPANGESPNNGYEIVPLATDLDKHQFKARIMAFIRSIAEQYSSLGHQYTQQAAYQKAVELAEEVLKREEAFLELGTGTTADVAEARQRLEQFKLDLTTKASDLITAHQSLQGLLGVPDGDSRRIVPITAPIEVAVSPDWDTSLATMLKNHPDIARSKAMLTKAEDQFRAAEIEEYYKALAPGSQPQEKPAFPAHSTRYQSAQNELLKRRESHQLLIQQTTHSLSRFRLELDANYKQFQNASQIQSAAVQRLAAQRAFREEGRITIDRYLDAIAQHASAAAQAAQFKSMYNVTLTSWAEILGTLLEREKITVRQHPSEVKLTSTQRESTAELAPKPHQTLVTPMDRLGPLPTPGPSNPGTVRAVSPKPNPNAALTGKSLSFEMTIAFGSKPITLKGSFTIKPVPSKDFAKAP